MNNCPACLRENVSNYCNKCSKLLFNGRDISFKLPFTRPEYDKYKLHHNQNFSIPGNQTKHSLKIEGNVLKLTDSPGEYIIKPVPADPFENLEILPLNEHLTMQIAGQIFKIPTLINGLIAFKDGEYALLTKRFDVISEGKKRLQEDLAQIAGRTEETHGENYKYEFSYEEIAELLKIHLPAYMVEIEKFFRRILFNFLFSNGDGHLRNFSIYRDDKFGDYLLTPAYDLLNTKLHDPTEGEIAMELFKDKYKTESFISKGQLGRADFEEFGKRIGIKQIRIKKIIEYMTSKSKSVYNLINRSPMTKELKDLYRFMYDDRMERIN